MIASWFGCGRRPDNHNGKSDGYAVASIRSAAKNSRLTAAAKPGPATVPNHNPQPQAPTALKRRSFRPAQAGVRYHPAECNIERLFPIEHCSLGRPTVLSRKSFTSCRSRDLKRETFLRG